MKKTVLTAVFALLFTLAAILTVRAAAEESPTYSADSLADYLRIIGGSGESSETAVGEDAMIRKIVTENAVIEAGQYVEEVYRAHFEHDRSEILFLMSEQEVLYGSARLFSAEYLCSENGKDMHVLFLSGKKEDAMISFLVLFEKSERKGTERMLNVLVHEAFFPEDQSMPGCA